MRHTDRQLHETWYEWTLSNGLQVTLFAKPHFATSCVMLTCPVGSLYEAGDDDEPAGIAHFLEHKLFEHDGADTTHAFSLLGAAVNAWTSYEETVCYFETAAADIQKPLLLLLSFLNQRAWQKASVEREKGIILEEHRSYMQDPDNRLFLETMRSLYPGHPIGNDITGTQASIMQISPAQLQRFYARHYTPANMHLTLVTPQKPERIFACLEQWAQTNEVRFPSTKPPARVLTAADVGICAFHSFSMPAESGRTMVGYRLPVLFANPRRRMKAEWEIRIALELWFSPLHAAYQTWLDQKRISVNFGYDLSAFHDLCYVLFFDEQQDANFPAWLDQQLIDLKHARISPEPFTSIQKRLYGEIVQAFDTPAQLCEIVSDHALYGVTLFDELRLLRKITADSCMKQIQKTDFSVRTATILQI